MVARGQAGARLPVIRARALHRGAPIKVFFPSGRIRVEAWDRDSVDVRGRIAAGEHFYLAGDHRGAKLGIDDHPDGSAVRPGDIVLRVPRGSPISIKSVSATIEGRDVSGWFYTVSGAIRLSGSATSIEAESMAGDVTLEVTVPWARARTGGGRLAIGGTPAELDAATVRGALDVRSAGIVRGRLASVAGDIRYAGTPGPGGLFDISNHDGAVELDLPESVSAVLELSTVTGTIANGFPAAHTAAGDGADGRTLHLQLGAGRSHVTVRTFRGMIRVRPKP